MQTEIFIIQMCCLSHSSPEGDFKPHLWRKLLGSGENGVRKVLTMWKVGASLFTCWGLPS